MQFLLPTNASGRDDLRVKNRAIAHNKKNRKKKSAFFWPVVYASLVFDPKDKRMPQKPTPAHIYK